MQPLYKSIWLCTLFLLLAGCLMHPMQTANTHDHYASVNSGSLKVGARERHYLAYTPTNLPPNAPVLIALHGSLGGAQQMRALTAYRFEKLADQHHFAVLYPEGFEQHWDDCRKAAHYSARTQHIDDVAFMRELVNYFHTHYQTSLKKVYVVGYSNGGHMAFRLALEAPDLVSAIAVISANLPTAENLDCKIANKPVSAMIINGTLDPINPYNGGNVSIFGFGNRGSVRSTRETANWFAQMDKAALQPSVSEKSIAERSVWKSVNGVEVAMLTIHGGGHTLPQPYTTYPLFLGWTYRGIDGPQEIWDFFARQG